jgi:hypothetical protein
MSGNIAGPWGKPLFEVAAYRTTVERWHEELAGLDEQAHATLGPRRGHIPKASHARSFMRMGELLRSEIGHFPYGQVVGWLRLLHDGPSPVIKGYSYKLPQKRIPLRFRSDPLPRDRQGDRA